MLNTVLDLLIPKQNLNFTSIHSYLSETEIKNQESFFKIPEKSQGKILETIFVCADLKNSLISDLIHRAKFNLEFAIASDFAKLIKTKTEHNELIPHPDLIIPVPSDPKRLLIRGYHLPSKITLELSRILTTSSIEFVIKKQSTQPQTKLHRKDRFVNLKNIFSLPKNWPLNISKFTNIWLIDDITTTGTTLAETAKVLKSEFPFLKIYGIATASNKNISNK